ncbi:MAG TPA: Gldg family protein [Vicinamibacterales bacterium]|nr:Gldg family protein [Vicinamibacterales bacterium]
MKQIVGLFGWLGLVLVLAALALRFIRPEMESTRYGLTVAGLVVTGLYVLSQWRDIARSFQGRNVKYGSIAAGSVVIFLAILIGINWIGSRQNKRWDLTSEQQFSLSDQSKQVVAELQKPLHVIVFYDGGQSRENDYRDKLDQYAYMSTQISVEYMDAMRDPTRAQGLGVNQLPTVILQYDGRTERSTSVDEQSLTNALKKVVLGQTKKVYFLQGHGERDITGGQDPGGYSGAATALKDDNFETAPLVLAQAGKVPDDATVIVAAGPTSDFLAGELDLIKAYLAKGGKLLLMIDPVAPDQKSEPTGAIALAAEWGAKVGNDLIVDASGLGQLVGGGAETPVAMPAAHPITNNFREMSAFRVARSVTPIEGGANGHFPQKVVESGPQSWAETDLKGLYSSGRPEKQLDKGDTAGPLPIAVAVSAAVTTPAPPPAADGTTPPPADAPKPETRVVIVGDSDFAGNRMMGIPGNRNLFLNMVNWLAQQENLIAVRPNNPGTTPFAMTLDQANQIMWLTIFIIPGLLLAYGVRVWWKRR